MNSILNTGGLAYVFVNVIIGAAILIFGRKLFWFFVGFIGFAVGFHFAPYVWNVQSHGLLLVLAILTGIVAAVLSVFFQKIAVGVAGFAAGGYILIILLDLLGFKLNHFIWLPYLIGGVVGAVLLYLIFDWTLIIVSSFSGASLIIQTINLNPLLALGVYVALVILGIIIQTVLYQKSSNRKQVPDDK